MPMTNQLFSETEYTDQKNLADILHKTTREYMKNQTNLNIITASPVKSRGFTSKKHSTERIPCIVFYVCLKGYIPILEEEFPRQIGSYKTDVRESAFTLFCSHEPYMKHLKMGCSIGEDTNSGKGENGGTLGAFVDLKNGKTGCITSAHVLLDSEKLLERKNTKMDSLAIDDASTIYQPAPMLVSIQDNKPFGRVTSVVYKTGEHGDTGVEAGLITITDPNRYPVDGKFPKLPQGYTEENQLKYMSGSVLKSLPDEIGQHTFYKYGATTGLTRGAFILHASAVRTNGKLNWGNCELHNQIEVVSLGEEPFAKPGDSGALVLLKRNDDLQAIGIVTGGTTDFTKFYVTPIWEVLKALDLSLQLKKISQQGLVKTDESSENESIPTEIDTIRQNMEEVKTNIEKEVQTVGNKIASVELKVESINTEVINMSTKVDTGFSKLAELIKKNPTQNNNDAI